MPLKIVSFNREAQFSIRDGYGAQIDYLPSNGGDLLLDFQLLTAFFESGTWTLIVDARLGDENNTCLFAMSVTQ